MKDKGKTAAAIAGAVGSAAIAAALLYAGKRRNKAAEPPRTSKAPHIPSNEPPETD